MNRVATAIGVMLFFLVGVAEAQAGAPKIAPELKHWELWVGDWTLVGTAKDNPTEPEYKVDWRSQGRWILEGFFVEFTTTWKGKGPEQHWLEILSYDAVRSIHTFSGFSSTGETWTGTATFGDSTLIETGISTFSDGKVVTWRITWIFSADRMTISGRQEWEQGGVRWTSFTVKGTKAKTAMKAQ